MTSPATERERESAREGGWRAGEEAERWATRDEQKLRRARASRRTTDLPVSRVRVSRVKTHLAHRSLLPIASPYSCACI